MTKEQIVNLGKIQGFTVDIKSWATWICFRENTATFTRPTPSEMRMEACVWRKSWNQIFFTLARSVILLSLSTHSGDLGGFLFPNNSPSPYHCIDSPTFPSKHLEMLYERWTF
jgi:hypothetical protein